MQNTLGESIINSLIVGYELIVTTPSEVYSWSEVGRKRLFRSDTMGILASKRTSAGGGLLGISDGYGVLLHNPETTSAHAYKLRTSKGRIHPLHFDEPSQRLFFLTSMQHSVQCFSTAKFALLPPAAPHPSAPSVFAFSAGLNVILSASIKPSLVLLSSIAHDAPPIVVVTKCSRTPVSSAAFQAHPGTVLALSFMDGTVAVYDVLCATGDVAAGLSSSQTRVRERGHLQRLHAFAPTSTISNPSLHEDSSADSAPCVRSGRNDNISLAFSPSNLNVLVTAGPDGRCSVIEISPLVRVRNHWNTGAPVSSLALIMTPKLNDGDNSIRPEMFVIAVGRVDGVLTFFNVDGHHLVDVALSDPHPIIGVDCVPLHFSTAAIDLDQCKSGVSRKVHQPIDVTKPELQVIREHPPGQFFGQEYAEYCTTSAPASNSITNSPTKSQYHTPRSSPTKQEKITLPEAAKLLRDQEPSWPLQIPKRTHSRIHQSSTTSSKSKRRTNPKPPGRHSSSKSSSRSDGNIAVVADEIIVPSQAVSDNKAIETEQQKPELNRNRSKTLPATITKQPHNDHSDVAASYTSSRSVASNEAVLAWNNQIDGNGLYKVGSSRLLHSNNTLSKYSHSLNIHAMHSTQIDSTPEMKPAPLSFQVQSKFVPRPQDHVQDSAIEDQPKTEAHSPEQTSAIEPTDSPVERKGRPIQIIPSGTESQQSLEDGVDRKPQASELRQELKAIREELRTQLTEQREWFEGALKEQLGRKIQELNQRNRVLKLELFRLRDKEKGNDR